MGITCYRLYDQDIPEVPLVVDRYEDYLHLAELRGPPIIRRPNMPTGST